MGTSNFIIIQNYFVDRVIIIDHIIVTFTRVLAPCDFHETICVKS